MTKKKRIFFCARNKRKLRLNKGQ